MRRTQQIIVVLFVIYFAIAAYGRWMKCDIKTSPIQKGERL